MTFEKNENGCICFTDTAGISADMWRLILNRFNHLGYAMPDTDSVKAYFDRHMFLQKDQSIEVLIIFGQMHEPDMYPEKQILTDNQKAKEYFGTTENPVLAGYLLTDGSMLLFSYEGYKRDMDHREIYDAIGTDMEESNDTMHRFVNYGNIRLGNHGFYIARRPNEKQKRMLSQIIRQNPELYVDIANSNGIVVKNMKYEFAGPATVLRDIEEYFQSIDVRQEV